MFQKQPIKKVILKLWQNWQENVWTGVSFSIKLQVSDLGLKTPTQLFSSEFWAFCLKHHWVTASEYLFFINYIFLISLEE